MGKITIGGTGPSYQYNKVRVNTEAARCPRCTDRVYFNEEVRALNKAWHKKCFTCAECKRPLDSTRVNNHGDEIYCNNCHKKQFGPHGYGFAGGASGLATDSGRSSPRSTQLNTITVPQHAPSTGADPNDTRNCPRCCKRVYFAEEVKAMGRNWHRLCFKCGSCKKLLQPGQCSEHEEMPYCQHCYQRKAGIKGYGYGVGAGILQTEPQVSASRPAYGSQGSSPSNSLSNSPSHSLDSSLSNDPSNSKHSSFNGSLSNVPSNSPTYNFPARRRSSAGRQIEVISAIESLKSSTPDTDQWTESVYV